MRGEYSPSACETERGDSTGWTLPGVVRLDDGALTSCPAVAPVLGGGVLPVGPSLPTTIVMRGLDDDRLRGDAPVDEVADMRRIERADDTLFAETAGPASPSLISRLDALDVKLGRWGMREEAKRAAATVWADGAGRGGLDARAKMSPVPDWSGDGGISSSGVERANHPLRRRRMNKPSGARVSELVNASAWEQYAIGVRGRTATALWWLCVACSGRTGRAKPRATSARTSTAGFCGSAA